MTMTMTMTMTMKMKMKMTMYMDLQTDDETLSVVSQQEKNIIKDIICDAVEIEMER